MSFSKASDLLKLAEMATARHHGVSLSDITQEFGCDYRTARRMMRALEQVFGSVVVETDESQRKRWSLPHDRLSLVMAQSLRDSELLALEMGIRRAESEGAEMEVGALKRLRDRLLASMPKPHARRVESDAEAVMEALGHAFRPGPRVNAAPGVITTIEAALRGPFEISITYAAPSADGVEDLRQLQPYGLLLGTRRYLVAIDLGKDRLMRHFRVDRIKSVTVEPRSFPRDPEFCLEAHAARAFGSFQTASEYGEVVWRFTGAAAAVARDYQFHPNQTVTQSDDGAVTVRFTAAGHLEMAWHLYQWGDGVEVLEPLALRQMVENHQRSDFVALP